jgi:ectoine hydroxylase-related dioxygenase (phytanoyl-CoA dioxygenase family)
LDNEEKRGGPAPGGIRAHTQDAQWRYLATHPNVAGIARQLTGGPPLIVQTMLMDKPAAGGKGISLHQDVHHLPNEPQTLMACWIALTDTDAENGGLCVVPGSHRQGVRSTHQCESSAESDSWVIEHPMRDREGREWMEKMYSYEIDDLDDSTVVRLRVPRGGGVFFTGLTIHGSYANRSVNRPRKAWAVHYVREGTWVQRCDVQETVPAT